MENNNKNNKACLLFEKTKMMQLLIFLSLSLFLWKTQCSFSPVNRVITTSMYVKGLGTKILFIKRLNWVKISTTKQTKIDDESYHFFREEAGVPKANVFCALTSKQLSSKLPFKNFSSRQRTMCAELGQIHLLLSRGKNKTRKGDLCCAVVYIFRGHYQLFFPQLTKKGQHL